MYAKASLVIFSGKVRLQILFLIIQTGLSEFSTVSTGYLCNQLKQVNPHKSKTWTLSVPFKLLLHFEPTYHLLCTTYLFVHGQKCFKRQKELLNYLTVHQPFQAWKSDC